MMQIRRKELYEELYEDFMNYMKNYMNYMKNNIKQKNGKRYTMNTLKQCSDCITI